MNNPFKSIGSPIFKRTLYIVLVIIFVSGALFLLIYHLNNWPAVWWDEGWTLDAARNWVETGHLGHNIDGLLVPPRIPVRFPIVVPIGISMKILGVGIWQGRLPGIIFTILALCLTYYLSLRIFNRKVAIASVVLLLFLSPFNLNTIVIGRQVLAEMPMMFYLFAGYAFLLMALTGSSLWGLGAALLFGVSIHAKLQVPPFWVISMVMAAWSAISYQQRRSLAIIGGVSAGSFLTAAIILIIQNALMPGSFNDSSLINLLANSAVVVLSWPVRIYALINVGLYFIPQLLAFIWAGHAYIAPLIRKSIRNASVSPDQLNHRIIAVALWSLGASWFAWYLLLAMFWTRYLFPPYFIGCVFLAAYLGEISGNLSLKIFFQRAIGFILGRERTWKNIQATIMLLLISLTVGITVKSTQVFAPSSVDPIQASQYINKNIPSGSRVEMFESELLFLSPGVRFHVPSDRTSMQLVRKMNIDPSLSITYDPLETNPDFLIVGPYARVWHLYDEAITNGGFQLEADIGGYKIYRIQNSSQK